MTIGQRIKHLRSVLSLTQQGLADLIEVSRGAVGNWERDEGIKTENLQVIAERTGAAFEWLSMGRGEAPQTKDDLTGEARPPEFHAPESAAVAARTPVVGYAGAGSAMHYFPTDGELDEVTSPEGANANTKAVEIRGQSLGLMFDRWYAFFDDVRRPITSDLIGRLCVVGLADGRVLVKKVQNGKQAGRYTLLSEREDPLEDVSIRWAARVTLLREK